MTAKKTPVILWFRQDLRLTDNQAYEAVCAADAPVLPLYILDDESSGHWKMGEASRWWLHESLHALDLSLGGALRFARGDTTELPGFEQDDYVPYSKANERDIEDILAEYSSVRQATLTLFRSFDAEALERAGVANGHLMSVRAAAYHIAGHELHHLNSIRENYGAG